LIPAARLASADLLQAQFSNWSLTEGPSPPDGKVFMRFLGLFLAANLVCLSALAASNPADIASLRQSSKVGPGVADAFSKADYVTVGIAFEPPLQADRTRLREWNDAIRRQRQAIFSPYIGKGLEVLREFESINGIEVKASARALSALVNDPDILNIDLPMPTQTLQLRAH
jgi:hypothetical protein